MSNPQGGASLGVQPAATLTIVSDDSVLGFSSSSHSVNENALGGRATINVTRTGSTNGLVSVNYATASGTAMVGADFSTASGVLTFAPGETRKTFGIAILDDLLVEGNETVQLVLSNPSVPAILGQAAATLTILENDFAPGVLQFGAASYAAGEDGTNAIIRIIRTYGVTGVVAVNLGVSDGTARVGLDYLGVGWHSLFADGEVVKTVLIPILNDALTEGMKPST